MNLQLFLCIAGLGALIAAPLLCWFQHDREWLWLGVLIAGEIMAWSGALPILSKFF